MLFQPTESVQLIAGQQCSEAYFWDDLAAAGKLEAAKQKDATKHRDDAASHLTAADLSRVQERARKWAESHLAKADSQ